MLFGRCCYVSLMSCNYDCSVACTSEVVNIFCVLMRGLDIAQCLLDPCQLGPFVVYLVLTVCNPDKLP